MIRHNLALVRMRQEDQTFHCEVHGLLNEAETVDALQRAGLDEAAVHDRAERARRWPFSWLVRLIDSVMHGTGPKCEIVQ